MPFCIGFLADQPWKASIALETLAKSFLNPPDMHCRVLGVRGEQITCSSVSRKGDRRTGLSRQ
jgi:hypothetical protein